VNLCAASVPLCDQGSYKIKTFLHEGSDFQIQFWRCTVKRIKRWLRSRTGLAVVASLLVLVALLAVVGFKLGWWSLAGRSLTGTAGGGVEVRLTSYTGAGEHGRAVLRWQTGTERNCQGFHLYRAQSGTNAFVQVNSSLIAGKPPAGGSYRYNDMTAVAGATYDYRLLAVGPQGQQVQLGSVTVAIP
jgi:hypothetical protein